MSHLPLLFADGQPTSLDKITQPQLERFIQFMLQCCPKSSAAPKWWIREIPFSFPLKAPPSLRKDWMPLLKELVERCYNHYESSYILSFCKKLALLGIKRLYLKENADRIDIFERTTNKLLVSVKSKNKNYDLPSASPHKSLLPRPLSKQAPYKSIRIDDIVLCTYCDAEFTCCKDACEHERTEHAPPIEEKSTPQERTLRSIGLLPVSQIKSDVQDTSSKPRRITSNLCLKKCHSIPICTPLGSLLLANTPIFKPHEIMKSIEKSEEFCRTDNIHLLSASRKSNVRRSRRMIGVSSATQRFRQSWSHKYCFNKKQRAEQMRTMKTGLDADSRRLLQECNRKILKVKIRRLPPLPGTITLDLRRIRKYISEEYPNQKILETRKPVQPQPPPPPPPLPPTVQFQPNRFLNPVHRMVLPGAATQLFNSPSFVKRSPLAGMPSNRQPIKPNINCGPVAGIITKKVPFGPIRKAVPRDEPVVIDLCSSDEDECEIVATPEKPREVFRPLANASKYGVSVSVPNENSPLVSEAEKVGMPAKDKPTVMFVQQLCRTRS